MDKPQKHTIELEDGKQVAEEYIQTSICADVKACRTQYTQALCFVFSKAICKIKAKLYTYLTIVIACVWE